MLTLSFIRWILTAFMGLFLAVAQANAGALPDWADRPDEDLYVFGLQLERYTLTDGFITFYDGKEYFLPLGGFTQALEFPISVDPEAGTARGWFLNDDRRFDLDLATFQVTVENRIFTMDPKNVERHPDDIYVALSELERWFPVLLEAQFRDLQINITAREPLPLQERIAREDRRSRISWDVDNEELDRIETKPAFFEWPFVDINIQAGSRQRADQRGGNIRQTTTVVGIVAGLDMEATAVADSEFEAPNIRLRLGQRSTKRNLLGPLNAQEFSFGDIATPDLPLIADNTVGRGFVVSSYDLNRLEQTNRVTLRGELPVGWEIEVYRNGELIDFQTDQDVGNGRYEFSNLPTLGGLNKFRLVFYGPQGQTREQTEQYFVTSELAKPGKSSYRFAYNRSNLDLISLADEENSQTSTGEDRFIFQAEHGLTETLSLRGGLASILSDEERQYYATAGLQSSLFGALVHLDLAMDDTGGLALGGRTQAQFGSWSLFAQQSLFQDFHSEQSDNGFIGGHLRSRTVVRVNGHLPYFGLGHQPLSAAMTHEISEQGAWQTTLFSRISSIIRPFNLALSTTTQIREQEDIVSEARLLVGTLVGDFRLRGEMGFDISPETAFSQANMSADWRINENFGARVGLKHVSGDEEVSTASAGIFRDFDGFNLGVGLEADSKGDYSVQLGLSFSFGHNPATDSIEFSSKPFAKRSAVSALVFLDRDNDGVFDPEDTAIENAGFSGSRVPRDITTSEDGTAFIVGLQPYRDVKIGLNEATLEDPFWVPSKRPKYVSMRPGTSTTILFPVIETGEVDG
ncbi:MAG: hypothetical protein JKY04_09155, partial [Sneathiella sp.]|nr:hypothetical protein [Sneathiella sp.]